MKRVAFVFAGQASQKVGMGRDIYDHFPEVRLYFEAADAVTGRNITQLCFEGPEDELTLTLNAQPAIFTFSIACWHLLKSDISYQPSAISFFAGHSLGEFSALVAAGALDFEDGLKLVNTRAQLMNQAHPGSMAAIIGASKEKVQKLCEAASEKGIVVPANFNSPEQIVISGETEAVKRAVELAPQFGAQRAVLLNVSGAFHSPLMRELQARFAEAVEATPFRPPQIPVVANVTAEPTTDPKQIKQLLVQQLVSPVLWEQSIRFMLSQGIETLIEVGPQRVLSGLIRRIERKANVLNVEDMESLGRTLAALSGSD